MLLQSIDAYLSLSGWFILLTSLLGFWRVKRWERGIVASQRDNAPTPAPAAADEPARSFPFVSQFERAFGLRGISRTELFRQGLGLGGARSRESRERADEDAGTDVERELMIPVVLDDPERQRTLEHALATERQLQSDLRAAGLV